jgi:hypothetical protein
LNEFPGRRRFRRQSLPDEHCPQSPEGSMWTAQTCPGTPAAPSCQDAARLLVSAKLHPTCAVECQVWCFAEIHLACRGRASETNRAPQRAGAMVQAAFTGSPCTSPVAAISLSVALWKLSAVVPTPSVPQPGTVRVGQVFRRSPRMVDVQSNVQSCRGFDIFAATSEQTISPGVELFCSRKPHTFQRVCGFRISRRTQSKNVPPS